MCSIPFFSSRSLSHSLTRTCVFISECSSLYYGHFCIMSASHSKKKYWIGFFSSILQYVEIFFTLKTTEMGVRMKKTSKYFFNFFILEYFFPTSSFLSVFIWQKRVSNKRISGSLAWKFMSVMSLLWRSHDVIHVCFVDTQSPPNQKNIFIFLRKKLIFFIYSNNVWQIKLNFSHIFLKKYMYKFLSSDYAGSIISHWR